MQIVGEEEGMRSAEKAKEEGKGTMRISYDHSPQEQGLK